MEQKKDNSAVERLAAENILQRGIKIKIAAPFFLRWFGKKTITAKLYSPYEGTLMRVSAYYLSTGLKDHQLDNITVENSLLLLSIHGKAISKAVACALLNGYWSGLLFTKPLAWYLRWNLKAQELFTLTYALLIYGGTSDFMSTTRLVRSMKTTSPNLGQTPKES